MIIEIVQNFLKMQLRLPSLLRIRQRRHGVYRGPLDYLLNWSEQRLINSIRCKIHICAFIRIIQNTHAILFWQTYVFEIIGILQVIYHQRQA
jgi:hypothetical protein